MRVSTNTIYEVGTASMGAQQEQLLKLQQQIGTGRRVLTPADDPVNAAHALQVRGTDALNDRYRVNRDAAQGRLGRLELAFSRYVGIVQDVRARAIAAVNGTFSDRDRQMLATEVSSYVEELLGLANTRDEEGHFLFSGYQADVQPFARSGAVVAYAGDEGQRTIAVAPSRVLPMSVSGAAAFDRIRSGNGVFAVAAAGANAGTAIAGAGTVTNAGALTGDTYNIVFTVAGTTTTYDVVDTTTSTVVASAQPYTSGSAIGFDGMQIEVSGAPANGDGFTVSPSANRSAFKTLDELIAALNTPASGGPGQARLVNSLNSILLNLDQVLDRALFLQGGAGSALRELDALGAAGESLGILNKQEISRLEDLDYARAVSDLGRTQVGLEAAQKAFLRVAGLSLFDYL